jgi:hypothetical protein
MSVISSILVAPGPIRERGPRACRLREDRHQLLAGAMLTQ